MENLSVSELGVAAVVVFLLLDRIFKFIKDMRPVTGQTGKIESASDSNISTQLSSILIKQTAILQKLCDGLEVHDKRLEVFTQDFKNHERDMRRDAHNHKL